VKPQSAAFLEKSRSFSRKRKTCSTRITGPTKRAARHISLVCTQHKP
jgi:hypothetical protein